VQFCCWSLEYSDISKAETFPEDAESFPFKEERKGAGLERESVIRGLRVRGGERECRHRQCAIITGGRASARTRTGRKSHGGSASRRCAAPVTASSLKMLSRFVPNLVP